MKKWSQFKEDVGLTIRGYRLLIRQGMGPLLAYRGAASAVKAVPPLVNLYFSGLLLNELAGPREPQRLIWLAALAAVSNLLLTLLGSLLQRRMDARNAMSYHSISMVYTKKLLSMDYEDVEDTRVHEHLEQMRELQNWQGWGLGKLCFAIEEYPQSLVGVMGSAALAFGLFAAPAQKAEGLAGVLASPWGALLLAGLMGASCLVFKKCAQLLGSTLEDFSKSATLANRLFTYFRGTLAGDHKQGKDVRLYGEAPMARHAVEESDREIVHSLWRAEKNFLAVTGGQTVFPYLISCAAYLVVAAKAWCGAIELGSVVLCAGAVSQFAANFQKLVDGFSALAANVPHLRSTFQFLDMPNRKYQGTLPTEKREDNDYLIEFHDVSFQYPGTTDWAIRHLNLTLKIGERLAVVGRNGSGKTTMTKLLCRLYDPTEGYITLNGIDIKKYNYQEYMALFSVVFQDFHLFSFPLGQAVAASMKYDRAAVEEALVQAGLEERRQSMPQGLDTYLNKDFDKSGVELSGGEAQKTAIARALYKSAPFLVLDEPTAALDPIAEYEVYRRFGEIAGQKTAVCISHRLSSCRFCDRIAVFEKGRLVQLGSHDRLVEEDGAYQRLWRAQAKYYDEKGGAAGGNIGAEPG